MASTKPNLHVRKGLVPVLLTPLELQEVRSCVNYTYNSNRMSSKSTEQVAAMKRARNKLASAIGEHYEPA